MAARLDANATHIVEEARSLARHHHHDVVDLEHLLRALLTSKHGPFLTIEGVSRPELIALLDARLAARPRSALYRDVAAGTEPVLSAAVETAIRRAGTGRGLALFRPIDPRELLVAAIVDPALAALVAEATIETAELLTLLEEARALALRRSNELVTVDHVLSVLLDASWFDAALRAVGADPRDLHWRIEARLAAEARSPSLRRAVSSHEVEDVARVATAHACLVGAEAVVARHFVLPLLVAPHRAPAFVDAGVDLVALRRYLATGHADAGEDAPDAEGDLEVIFHNDDSTTMDFVVEVLTECFSVLRSRAMTLMRQVHETGECSIGVFTADDARTRVAAARVMAENASMPLRVSLRPVAAAPFRAT